MKLSLLAALALSLLPSVSAAAQDRVLTLAGRRVAVWEPAETAPASGRSPMLIFSHGHGACATRSSFLASALAARGYWVFAPQHRDGSCVGRRAAPPERPFGEPARWSDATYLERRDDVRAVERALRADRVLSARLDFSRLGYVGHSLGGYTMLGLAGAWPSWAGEPRPRAVLALSPYVEPFLSSNTLRAVGVPVMYQGGTADGGITPSLTRAGGAYDDSRAPKYLVVFRGARHGAWGDRGDRATHRAIIDYAIAFLDRYMRGVPAPPLLTTAGPGVSTLRVDSGLVARPGTPSPGAASQLPGKRTVKQLP
jgi:predicted dienelactone hydrolase